MNTVLGALACFLLLHARVAFAGQTGAPVGTAGMSGSVWSWVTFFTGILVYAAQWVDPANMETPGHWTGKSRMAAFAVLGLLVGVLHAITKDPSVPWTDSLLTGVMTIVLPGLLHFAPGMLAKAKAGGGGVGPAAGGALVLLLCVSVTPPREAARAHARIGGLTGCSLLPSVKTGTPLEDAIAVEQVAAFTDGLAVQAWEVAKAFIPAADLATATAAYTKAQEVYVASMQVLQDGIAAAKDGAAQNWGAMVAAIKDAISAVVTVLEQFGAIHTASKVSLMTPEYAGRLDAVHKAQATLARYH